MNDVWVVLELRWKTIYKLTSGTSTLVMLSHRSPPCCHISITADQSWHGKIRDQIELFYLKEILVPEDAQNDTNIRINTWKHNQMYIKKEMMTVPSGITIKVSLI